MIARTAVSVNESLNRLIGGYPEGAAPDDHPHAALTGRFFNTKPEVTCWPQKGIIYDFKRTSVVAWFEIPFPAMGLTPHGFQSDTSPWFTGMAWKSFLILAMAVVVLGCGCTTLPENPLRGGKGDVATMEEIMARRDRIIHLTSVEMDGGKPVLVLVHGATDDPTEMMDIVQAWRGKYDVYLFAYNYHRPVRTIAADFVNEIKRLRLENRFGDGVTFVAYSYGAIVFREAVIITDDRTLFSDASLIQLVPTAGGSFLARNLKNPVMAWVVSLFSKPTYAENPNGGFAEGLWAGAGNRKFYDVINPGRVHSILVAGDPHSLAGIADTNVRARYNNGIGLNAVVIPQSAGVTHDYFPSQPAALEYLRRLLGPPVEDAGQNWTQIVARK